MSGNHQSPIDIRNPQSADLPPIQFDYKPSPLDIIDNGHTIMINYAPGSFISVEKGNEEHLNNIQIDLTRLPPADREYFTFDGSLTTPPCSEGVTWYVLKYPVTVTAAEIEQFSKLYCGVHCGELGLRQPASIVDQFLRLPLTKEPVRRYV